MARMFLAQLRDKDVINLCNAARIGYINEIEFDSCSGQICSLVLCRDNGWLSFTKEEDLVLPWNRIECIGEDAILVKIPEEELSGLGVKKGQKRKNRTCGCK